MSWISNIKWAVEKETMPPRTNSETIFSHPKVYSDVGDEQEGLVESATDGPDWKSAGFCTFTRCRDAFVSVLLQCDMWNVTVTICVISFRDKQGQILKGNYAESQFTCHEGRLTFSLNVTCGSGGVLLSPASVCWFFSRITQKLLSRFSWNSGGGWVSAQNRAL